MVIDGKIWLENVDHYLDDIFFAGSPLCSDCANLMSQFEDLCDELGIPIASEKTQSPTSCLTYLDYELDTVRMQIRISIEKVLQVLEKVNNALASKRSRLRSYNR